MIRTRHAAERGRTSTDWLDSRHSFAFGAYRDAAQLGFRNLRVINEDRVAPGKGFAPHSHRDMEIVTLVLAGALEHRDSLGHGSVIRPGEVQRMSAGTGITHSELNASATEPVHFLQIWIEPALAGLEPSYEQRAIAERPRGSTLLLLASAEGREGSLGLNARADLYVARIDAKDTLAFAPRLSRNAWLQVIRGGVNVAGIALAEGDGAALHEEREVAIAASSTSELLVFDLR